MSDSQQAAPPALIAEATKRAGVIWIKAPGAGRPQAAWHVWRQEGEGGAAYLLTGPGQQPLPALTAAQRVTVLVPSKDTRGLLVTWHAQVSRVQPGTPGWDAVIGALAAGRLNDAAATGAGAQVFRLTPAG